MKRFIRGLTAGLLALCALPSALALPSFARQTGAECAACHIAGMGPHLTPRGIFFKLSGYTEGDNSTVPLSADLKVSHNERALPGVKDDDRLDTASIYLAGRLLSNVGALVKATHTRDSYNVGAAPTDELAMVDLRYADTARLAERDLAWGLTFNNHPGLTDPVDVNPSWGFPAVGTQGSMFNPLTQPTVPRRVLGLTAYRLWDSHWYGEVGGYTSMSRGLQDSLGEDPQNDPGKFSGIAPYWRLAYLHDLKTQFFRVGLTGMSARRQLAVISPSPRITERSGPYDRLQDVAVDGMYEYLGNRDHVVQLRAMYTFERRHYGGTLVSPFTGAVAHDSANVRERTLAATYVFHQRYGLTAALLNSWSSQDPVRNFPFPTTDSRVRYLEVFWTPFGKEDSWMAPWANMRLAASWNRIDRFNGGTTNVFGPLSPNARDLNGSQLYAEFAF